MDVKKPLAKKELIKLGRIVFILFSFSLYSMKKLYQNYSNPFNPETTIPRILVLPDKQIAVVGSTRSKHYQGVSGADFDILIMLLDDK